LDRRLTSRERARSAAAFLLGFSPVALQFLIVWLHTGEPWLYDREYMRVNFAYPGRDWGVEAVFHTMPAETAYMVRATTAISRPTLLALRLHRGLFGFEWAVYHQEAWRGRWWTPSLGELAWAWLSVLAYLTGSAWAAWRAPASLRLLNAIGLSTALITAAIAHTELRYYLLPRLVLWLTLACLCLSGLQRSRRGRASRPSSAPARAGATP
jgi:hypothetical protein